MKTSEYLQKAKDVLLSNGWCQGTMRNGEGQFCTIGALDEVDRVEIGTTSITQSEHYWDAYNTVFRVIRSEFDDERGWESAVNWNDAEHRHFGEVVYVFDEAIRQAKEWEADE